MYTQTHVHVSEHKNNVKSLNVTLWVCISTFALLIFTNIDVTFKHPLLIGIFKAEYIMQLLS